MHEDGDGHQKRQPARGRGGGVHREAGRKRAVIIAIPFVDGGPLNYVRRNPHHVSPPVMDGLRGDTDLWALPLDVLRFLLDSSLRRNAALIHSIFSVLLS